MRCSSSLRHCSFESWASERAPSAHISARQLPTSLSAALGENCSFSGSPSTECEAAVNLDHLELLHHFETETCRNITSTDAQTDLYRKTIVDKGFSNPFLMYQTLALSAFHLSLQRPHRAAFYSVLAASLRSRAVAGFNEILPRVDASNCVDVLLFSHIIGLHVFCEIFTSARDDFNDFLERLVGCIKLLQGVQVVIQTWWDVLSRTEIGTIINQSHNHQTAHKVSRGECNPLRKLIDGADLSQSSINTCHAALDKLQACFDAENAFEASPPSTYMLFTWPVTASTEFTELIDKRSPEALVILAYYAVLLHKRRRSWAVADAGQRLVHLIHRHLGKHWEKWLVWPISFINGNPSSAAPTPGSTTLSETS